jgi:NAD(P)H-dependent flavin oxidoreductase YrpB (nitropropane dioxygenase family)
MARDDQVKVVAYSYLDLTGKIVRPVSKNIWLRPSVPNSAWVQVNHDTDDVILCVGYNAGGHAHVIYAGNLYTVAPSELETTIVTPSSVPLV